MKIQFQIAIIASLAAVAWAAPAPTTVTAKPAPVTSSAGQAPSTSSGQAELDVTIKGEAKVKVPVGKTNPPPAFNLEEIQNFPEERLQPVLGNPVTFNEGLDFVRLMDFKDQQLVHPWLPDIPSAPFLRMDAARSDRVNGWEFSVIDQGGLTVYRQEGKDKVPSELAWAGEDSLRGTLAVDTVYIPQLMTIDKENYHRTRMGSPVQFSAVRYAQQGKTIIELSSRRLFLEGKSEFTQEAPQLLHKVVDLIREDNLLPFAVQPYETNNTLARERQLKLVSYFKSALVIPENQIAAPAPQDPGKRGQIMAVVASALPGGTSK